ncbi:DNA polymerase IV [Sporolactobacillus putidus]|uniref:DNA polymerase IV n=2 Tax=Sporolactobacillus putidus TaxID=492735 RepID=A0A917W075_9BACL|nr:DNA polymerase IV [Sporolactobacillus putidus]
MQMGSTAKKTRVIFHVDMNSFYASVEIAHHPEWKGMPLAIAGKAEERHGIIVTSSYEARKMGVRTTMTVREARLKCPQLIVKHPDFELYRTTSDQLFKMLKTYTPLVEKASIDEGYMDVSHLIPLIDPLKLAKELQRRIFCQLHLPCSIGIAPNKFLAKTASNMKKPMGLTVLRKRELSEKLWPLPIGEMHGVGPKSEERFHKAGIQTVGDLAKHEPGEIAEWFGVPGKRLLERANGIDDRAVDPEAWDRYKSIGHSITLARDTKSDAIIRQTFDGLSKKLESKIKLEHVVCYEITVMIRYQDWKTVTRHMSSIQPIRSKREIMDDALDLFYKHWSGGAVRLLGVTLSSFQPVSLSTKQLDLFSYQDDARNEPLINLIDRINEKFGDGAIRQAGSLIDQRKNSLPVDD